MRRLVVFFFSAILLTAAGCKRQARSTSPPPITASETQSAPAAAPAHADAPTAAEVEPTAAQTLPLEASRPAAEESVASPYEESVASPYEDVAPPEPDLEAYPKQALPEDELESGLEPEIEPSPMDELAEVELFTLEVDEALEASVSADLRRLSFDIPVVLNQPVLQFLEYYQGRGRKIMGLGLQRSGRYLDYFRQIFEAEQVPRDLTYLPHIESLFKPRAYSRAHARGLWQFVLGTGRVYGLEADWWLDERSNVQKSTLAAARHLRDLYDEFGDWYLVLAAYNCGAGRIRRVLARHGELDYWEMRERRLLPRETRNYVPSFLAALIIFKHPENYGFDVIPDAPLEFEEVPLDYQLDLRVVAEILEMKPEELLELNPQLRRGVTPGRSDFALKVPLGTGAVVAEALRDLPEEQRLRVQHYSVRNGDTLSSIARRFGSSIRAIAEMNHIRNVHRLRLGQDLLIPAPGWRSAERAESAARAARPASYTVRRGDSLYRIAKRHGLTVAQLAAWNNLRPSQTIFPGQRLKLHRESRAAGSRQ